MRVFVAPEMTEGMKSSLSKLQVHGTQFGFVGNAVPDLICRCGSDAAERFSAYFEAQVQRSSDRRTAAVAVAEFCAWVDSRGYSLWELNSIIVYSYFDRLELHLAAPLARTHEVAVRLLLGWFVHVGILPTSPADAVFELESDLAAARTSKSNRIAAA